MSALSANTQAILLLTAPLLVERSSKSASPLTIKEYNRLALELRNLHRQPADLLSPDAEAAIQICHAAVDEKRIRSLLERGFLLSQAVQRWDTRAIWVLSRADAAYPRRLKSRLKDLAPPVLYGCGDLELLGTGGLAVVGSRHVDDALVKYAEDIGRRVAEARHTVVSGGARGIDQAAMHGSLKSGGMVVGVLADGLEKATMNRDNRNMLLSRRLALVSPYDPLAGFNVGNAMQRNKLIYAFADAALVVNSDVDKGGTWAGATEQLEKHRFLRVYVRSTGGICEGLQALQLKGAVPWPNPPSMDELTELLKLPFEAPDASRQNELPLVGSTASAERAAASASMEQPASAPTSTELTTAAPTFTEPAAALASSELTTAAPTSTEPAAALAPSELTTAAPTFTEPAAAPASTELTTAAPTFTEPAAAPASTELTTAAPTSTEPAAAPASTELTTAAPTLTEPAAAPASTELTTAAPTPTEPAAAPASTELTTAAPTFTEFAAALASTERANAPPSVLERATAAPTANPDPSLQNEIAQTVDHLARLLQQLPDDSFDGFLDETLITRLLRALQDPRGPANDTDLAERLTERKHRLAFVERLRRALATGEIMNLEQPLRDLEPVSRAGGER